MDQGRKGAGRGRAEADLSQGFSSTSSNIKDMERWRVQMRTALACTGTPSSMGEVQAPCLCPHILP